MPDRYQCSAASRDRFEPMFGTGSRVPAWFCVEVRGAWGADAVHESALGSCVPGDFRTEMRQRGMRVVCVRSRRRVEVDGVRLFACVAGRPDDLRPVLWRRDVAGLADVTAVARDLDLADPAASGWHAHPDPLVLVCTNGRHDQCCANLGRPLVRHLDTTAWGAHTWESSHVGGDRFAPNVVVLPDSLYFGRVDPAVSATLLDRWRSGSLDLDHFRGRTCLSFEQQAVEHHVRQVTGLAALDAVVVTGRTSEGAHEVLAGGERLHVRLRRHDRVVTDPLTCRGRGGQRVVEYELVSIEPAR